MAKFHILQVMHDRRLREFDPFAELVETLIWGLKSLGHTVTHDINVVDPHAINIVVCGQIMPVEAHDHLPADTIFYNFEQLRGARPSEFNPRIVAYSKRFRVWEYSTFNLPAWEGLALEAMPTVVPIGYAPILTRLPRPSVQDIDVLFYGGTGTLRFSAFEMLAKNMLKVAFLTNIYGAARDDLIARSKIMLNVSLYPQSGVFELARVSYLLANRKAVLAQLDHRSQVDPDIAEAVAISAPQDLARIARQLLADDKGRTALEERGFEIMRKRDIVPILAEALETLPT